MIKAVIFDLDNTLIDFMHMKNKAVDSAINGMIESGLHISYEDTKKKSLRFTIKRVMNIKKSSINSLSLYIKRLIIKY